MKKVFMSSVVIQGLVTLVLISVLSYLYVTVGDVPDSLLAMTGVVMGHWFGAKQNHAVSRVSGG